MFFEFEHEVQWHADLRRLPLYVRMKLDRAGLKLTLDQWLAFAVEERRVICHLPVEDPEELRTFVEYLGYLCKNRHASALKTQPSLSPALWNTARHIPPAVLDISRESGRVIGLDEWTRWQSHARYGLYKTATSKNEPEKFFALLKELRQRDNKADGAP
jgi:hypothetical protein